MYMTPSQTVITSLETPPLAPPSFQDHPNRVLRISKGDLDIVSAHLFSPANGVMGPSDPSSGPAFILAPRFALTESWKYSQHQLWCALGDVDAATKASFPRGRRIKIQREDRQKYSCLGPHASRGGRGISLLPQWAAAIPPQSQLVISKFFLTCRGKL